MRLRNLGAHARYLNNPERASAIALSAVAGLAACAYMIWARDSFGFMVSIGLLVLFFSTMVFAYPFSLALSKFCFRMQRHYNRQRAIRRRERMMYE